MVIFWAAEINKTLFADAQRQLDVLTDVLNMTENCRNYVIDKATVFHYSEIGRKPKSRSFPVRFTPMCDLRHSWAS